LGGYITFETDGTAFADIGTAKGISGNGAYSTTDLMIGARSGTKNIVFGMNGVEKVRIKSDGNVGIGTTDPGAYKLYVNGTTMLKGNVEIDGSLSIDSASTFGNSITFSSFIACNGGIKDDGGDYGTNGQVLSTNGSNAVHWVDQSGGGSGDITSVIGGTGIDVSGGSSGDATVAVDYGPLGTSFVEAAATGSTASGGVTHDTDYVLFQDTSAATVKKCLIKYLPVARTSTFSPNSSCGGTLYLHNGAGHQQDTTTITLSGCSSGGGGSGS
jgi:hypothetical protein